MEVWNTSGYSRCGRVFWNVGGLLPLSHMHTPIQIFSKCFLHCSLAQAIFTVSSVSVINLWQKLGSCPGSRASTCFLLGSFLSRPRAENVGSEVADVTGIVKYIRKSVFWHQAPPQFLFRGAMHPPAHCSAAYMYALPFKEAVSQLSGLLCSYCIQINLGFWETAHLPLP